jgi:hypothetical protein
MMING